MSLARGEEEEAPHQGSRERCTAQPLGNSGRRFKESRAPAEMRRGQVWTLQLSMLQRKENPRQPVAVWGVWPHAPLGHRPPSVALTACAGGSECSTPDRHRRSTGRVTRPVTPARPGTRQRLSQEGKDRASSSRSRHHSPRDQAQPLTRARTTWDVPSGSPSGTGAVPGPFQNTSSPLSLALCRAFSVPDAVPATAPWPGTSRTSGPSRVCWFSLRVPVSRLGTKLCVTCIGILWDIPLSS